VKRTPPRLAKPKSAGVSRGKFYLTYPKKLVKEPLIYQMTRKFDLVFNVRSASVSEEIGIIALELDGRPRGRGGGRVVPRAGRHRRADREERHRVMLTDAQVERYSRQIVLPEVGARGQERLLAARIALAGDGAAATSAAMLLGRAGVGALDVDEEIRSLPQPSPDCRIARGHRQGAHVAVVLPDDPAPSDDGASGMLWLQGPRTPIVLGILGSRLVVATLLWRSCLACFPDLGPLRGDASAAETAPAARMALGALAASEALRVLLTEPPVSRLTVFDVARGTAVVKETEPVGCRSCRTPA
jgi:hypothetical protein